MNTIISEIKRWHSLGAPGPAGALWAFESALVFAVIAPPILWMLKHGLGWWWNFWLG